MSNFSIKNGLKLSWFHLHDTYMLCGWFGAILMPAIVCIIFKLYLLGIIWFVIMNIIYVFIRCWSDPIQLGWYNK